MFVYKNASTDLLSYWFSRTAIRAVFARVVVSVKPINWQAYCLTIYCGVNQTPRVQYAMPMIHIGNLIHQELRRQERTVAWFARKICCTRPHAYKIFEKDNIDIKLLIIVCRVLSHDFFQDISDAIRNNIDDNSVI